MADVIIKSDSLANNALPNTTFKDIAVVIIVQYGLLENYYEIPQRKHF